MDLRDLGDAYISVEGVKGDAETELGRSSASVFLGQSQRMPHKRVFGGQVLARAHRAASVRSRSGAGRVPRHARILAWFH